MRQRLTRIAISLAVAAVFWLSVRLAATYHTVVEVPLSYEGLPTTVKLRSPLPRRLAIEVNSQGSQLMLRHLRWGGDTLTLDVSPGVRRGFLTRDDIGLQVESYFGRAVEILSVRPDTLRLDIEAKVLRRLAVVPQVTLEPEAGYWLVGPPSVEPDSVLVLATRSELGAATHWATEPRRLTDLSGPTQLRVPLQRAADVLIEPAEVTLSAEVEAYTEGTIELPLRTANLTQGRQLRLDPPRVRLRYLAPLRRFAQIRASDFELVIDGAEATGEGRLLTPVLTRVPADARHIRLEPPVVRYVLTESGR